MTKEQIRKFARRKVTELCKGLPYKRGRNKHRKALYLHFTAICRLAAKLPPEYLKDLKK